MSGFSLPTVPDMHLAAAELKHQVAALRSIAGTSRMDTHSSTGRDIRTVIAADVLRDDADSLERVALWLEDTATIRRIQQLSGGK